MTVKLAKLKKVCAASKRAMTCLINGEMYVGDGAAYYFTGELPKLAPEGWLVLFYVPEAQRGEWYTSDEQHMNIADLTELPDETKLEIADIGLRYNGHEIAVLTDSGGAAMLVRELYIDALSGAPEAPRYTYRGDIGGGNGAVVVRDGFMPIAVIVPFGLRVDSAQTDGDPLTERLEKLCAGLRRRV